MIAMKNNYNVSEENKGNVLRQILSSMIVCMPVLSYGTSMGWISPMTSVLQSNSSSPIGTPVSDQTLSWMASIMFIFAPPAVFVYGIAADIIGRKMAIIFTSVPMAMGWALKLLSTNAAWLIVARALLGIGCGACYVVAPLYVKELSDDKIRGTTGTFVILSQTIGNLIMYVLGNYLSYTICLWICLFIPLVHILLVLNIPESPSFLIKKEQIQEAANVVGWLKMLPPDNKIVLEAMHDLQNDQESCSTKFAPKLVFSEKSTRKAFNVSLIVNLAREFCGAVVVLVYASTIFEKSNEDGGGLNMSPNFQAMVLGAVQLMGSLLASGLVDTIGRKPLLSVTTVVAGGSMGLLGTWFFLMERGVNLPGWIPVTALCVCIFADAAGLQPLPFVIMTEMFSFQLRGTVATLILAISLAMDFGLIHVFHTVIETLGFYSAFWFFSAICFANVFYLLIYVPETKNRSLDAIYEDLK